MASLCHPGFTTTKLSYRFPIFETSATALCGTTGNPNWRTHMFQRGRYTTNQLLDRHIWRTILLVVKSLSFCLNCWSNQWCFRWLLRFPHRHWNRTPQIFARQNHFWMFWFDLPTCLLPLSPSGWCFGTCFIFYILPIDDLHHFSRWLSHHQPDCHFKLT